MIELEKLTELDKIFAGYNIVLPRTKQMIDECVEEATRKIAQRILNNGQDELTVFTLNKSELPSKALVALSKNNYSAEAQQCLVHHLALQQFFFSNSEGDSRFNTIFTSQKDAIRLFLDKEGKIDCAKAVFAKMLPTQQLNETVKGMEKTNATLSHVLRNYRLGIGRALGVGTSFVATRNDCVLFENRAGVIMVSSSGRSGSTMLQTALSAAKSGHPILKSHLLPPDSSFKGKILYIFSNPDLAAESALHLTSESAPFGLFHFIHNEAADRQWLFDIKDSTQQTDEKNLLAYDALGCADQLDSWLHSKTTPCKKEHAQILAIKYENLWESKQAIEEFLGFKFTLPRKKQRGYGLKQISPKEQHLRDKFNIGTAENPRYEAYDKARELWQQAPTLQYFQIKDESV